eukprot:TRINITY_DN3918_c0_g2_i3.p1 TRINITY_DN3918_c0_g2~~TRINITY_DN3918_c0_g2_i3.p1  ORF type:complete len:660 (-),score=124.04 TRINITY_DN3918_c0_g2_i3:436-2334(-)
MKLDFPEEFELLQLSDLKGSSFRICRTREDIQKIIEMEGFKGREKFLFHISSVLDQFRTQGDNRFEILKYTSPYPLLSTSGICWDYQSWQVNEEAFQSSLPVYYNAYLNKKKEKANTPLYLLGGGVGTGKSRLLSEFPTLSCRAMQSDYPAIAERLRTAITFNISFENGTAYAQDGEPKDPSDIIGLRMLYQLVREDLPNRIGFGEFRKNPASHMGPQEVLSQLASKIGIPLEKMTVFLMIDGLQKLMINDTDGLDKLSRFYSCIQYCASLAINCPAFIIICCAATVTTPFETALANSPQTRVFLKTHQIEWPTIDGKKILDPHHQLTKLLIDDMGGNGRAIEILQDEFQGKTTNEIDDLPISHVMQNLVNKLRMRYPDMMKYAKFYKQTLRVILANKILNYQDVIPQTSITPEQLVESGFMWFQPKDDKRGHLYCPYIWLYLIAVQAGEELQDWKFESTYDVWRDPTPAAGLLWQSFETFCAKFRVLKSKIYADQEQIYLGEILNGVKFKSDETLKIPIINQQLTLVHANEQYGTKSERNPESFTILHQLGSFDFPDPKFLVQNGQNAPYGDLFCSLSMPNKQNINEIHQMKRFKEKTTISKAAYEEEWKKSAQEDDIFIVLYNWQWSNTC